MNFLKKIFNLSQAGDPYVSIYFDIQLHGWEWIWDSLNLPESFIEENAERADWKKILRYQDFSDKFSKKFAFEFKHAGCDVISLNAEPHAIVRMLQEYFTKNVEGKNLSRLFSVKFYFQGRKGKETLKKIVDFTGASHFKVKHGGLEFTAFLYEKDYSPYVVPKNEKKNCVQMAVLSREDAILTDSFVLFV